METDQKKMLSCRRSVDRSSVTRPELTLVSWASSCLSGIILDDLDIASAQETIADEKSRSARANEISERGQSGQTTVVVSSKDTVAISMAEFDTDFFSGGDAAVGTQTEIGFSDASGPTPSSESVQNAAVVSNGILDMFGEMDVQPAHAGGASAEEGFAPFANGSTSDGADAASALEDLIQMLPDFSYMLAGTLQIKNTGNGNENGALKLMNGGDITSGDSSFAAGMGEAALGAGAEKGVEDITVAGDGEFGEWG